jgi:hypothetical protein
MDGTIADLYSVEGWLEQLRAYDVTPYREAAPMWDMDALSGILQSLQAEGWRIVIVTWLAKYSTKVYDELVAAAKVEWLHKFHIPVDEFYGVAYGTPKQGVIPGVEGAILIDDSLEVRETWSIGETVDPTKTDLIKYLETLKKAS